MHQKDSIKKKDKENYLEIEEVLKWILRYSILATYI